MLKPTSGTLPRLGKHLVSPAYTTHFLLEAVPRLCILREDLYLETLALIEETLPPLDKNTVVWRMTYFWS